MSWKTENAVRRIYNSFKRVKSNIYKEDIEALKTVADALENAKKSYVNDNALFAKLLAVKFAVESFADSTLLIYHLYFGFVPPLLGVALNEMLDPAQYGAVVVGAAVTLTAAAPADTCIVMKFDVSGLPVLHNKLEVITAAITSLFANVELVYVAPVSPAITVPFFNHT